MSKKSSPYSNTPIKGYYLDLWSPVNIEAKDTDLYVTIAPEHHQRPDLLAYELYGTPNLFWVFARRNMNVLIDPIDDFVAGLRIYIPDPDIVSNLLT